MKALIASVFALGVLGASAVPANAITIHFGSGYHHHWRHGYYHHYYRHSGWGWGHHYRHHGWRHHW